MRAQGEYYDLSELIQDVATARNYNLEMTRHIVEDVFRLISQHLATRRHVQLHAVGSFRLKYIRPRTYKLNGQTVEKDGRLIVKFTPAKAMRERIEAETGLPCVS